jgi:hypothetical protein
VKGKKKARREENSKKKHSQKKNKIDPFYKEVISTLIKMRTPPNIALKLKEKSTF